jgi:cation transport regulator ChaC
MYLCETSTRCSDKAYGSMKSKPNSKVIEMDEFGFTGRHRSLLMV